QVIGEWDAAAYPSWCTRVAAYGFCEKALTRNETACTGSYLPEPRDQLDLAPRAGLREHALDLRAHRGDGRRASAGDFFRGFAGEKLERDLGFGRRHTVDRTKNGGATLNRRRRTLAPDEHENARHEGKPEPMVRKRNDVEQQRRRVVIGFANNHGAVARTRDRAAP